MKTKTIIYWVATILLCALMTYSASMYFSNTEMIQGYFESHGYPSYIVIPLAIAKILGIIMLLTRKVRWLTDWAYAGFFFDLVLAGGVHYVHKEDLLFVIVGIVMLFVSFFLGNLVRPYPTNNV
ncbi:DoxX family protein [Spongiivirga citrea]|uniref:DoxX family protein n=1 Tax=Spongiivirga citrea TaxID=1481457 RepID=A0A6M0CP85_9FLAO|nr:DoxX family protein [Spongiivirga citrea]NER17287.1 DoxX family protein [Spongiivirga citrea]